MRIFGIVLVILTLAFVSKAQTATVLHNPPDLQVIKMSWKSEMRLAEDAVREEKDPLTAQPDRRVRPRPVPGARTSVYDSVNNASRENEDMWPSTGPRVKGYLYQVTVRNTGQKEIKAVSWQYIFTDPLDHSIVARHRFSSKSKIAPGKEKKLDEFALSPPTNVVNAKSVANNPEQPLIEQVEITRIEYTDGSVWERPAE